MDRSAIVIVDAAGVVQFWSPGAEALFGHLASNAVGQTVDFMIPAQYQADHWTGFRRAMEVGAAVLEGQINPFPVRHADGTIAAFPGRLTLVRQASGQVVGAMVVFG